MKTPAYSLRRRLVAAFVAFALVTVLLLSFLCIVFAYAVEDSFFQRMLQEEATYQLQQMASTGSPARPKQELIRIYQNADELPADLRRQYHPDKNQHEFAGVAGRHYHMLRINTDVATLPSLLLVAEVSQHLVVRPIRNELLWLLAKVALAVLVLTCIIGYALAHNAIAPLTRLAKQVADTEPANLPKDFAAQYPNNEIGILARSLENALQRIDAFIQREQHFTRDASHELRTPIAIMQSSAELLTTQGLPTTAINPLRRIQQASIQMEQTISLLLSLAREAPRQSDCRVALLPLIESAVVQFAHLLDDKLVEVHVEVDERFAVNAHQTVLTILLGNLISNAFQYTAAGHIRIHQEHDTLIITDTGIGIESDLQERMFEPLVKGEHSNGFGIGLSIVRRLCDRYGIHLAISTLAAGGTRAALRFPAAPLT